MEKLLNRFNLKSFMNLETGGISLLWLMQLTALLGIAIGYMDFFIPKTPINLWISFLILFVFFFRKNLKFLFFIVFCFVAGMTAEILGVNFGWFFGSYEYGNNLGLKIMGVPITIGLNWAVLTIVTGEISKSIRTSLIGRAIIASLMMLGLDFLMEFVSEYLDYWTFAGGTAPFENYVAWFTLALVLNVFYQLLKFKGNSRIAWHLYLCISLFFVFINVFRII